MSIVLVWILCRVAIAQVPAPPGTPTSAKRDQTGDAAYVVEQQHQRVRFDADGSMRRDLTLRVKVMDEQAVRAWGQLPFSYNSESEQLTLSRVEVHKTDGTVVATAPGAIQDFAVRPFPQLPIFLDYHQRVATISSLRPGDVLVVNAVWTTSHPVIPGQFNFAYSFNRTESVQDERLEINVPADKPVVLKNQPAGPAEETRGVGTVEGGRRIYRWSTSNVVVAKKADLEPDTENAPAPDVRLTTFKSWEEVGRWYRELLSKASDPRVASKAAELTKGLTDRSSKIDAIYTYVSTQLRYVSLSFGLGRFAPHAPGDVLANQYGDCKDKEALLAALLSAAGVQSAPVLVNTTRSVDDDFPSPLEFDHLIAVLPHGAEAEWLWLDSTTEVAPAGMLAAQVRQRKALLIGDAATPSRLVTTPADPPFDPVERIEVDGKVDGIGVLTARLTYTLRGDSELLVRSGLRGMAHEAWPQLAQALASGAGLEGDIRDVEASDPGDPHAPLRVTFTLHSSKFLDWAATSSETRVPAAVVKLPGSKEEDRKSLARLRLGSPLRIEARSTIEFPAGYTLRPPLPVTIKGEGLEYRSTYRVEGTRLIVERDLRHTIREIPSSQFGAYSAFVGAVDADVAQQVTIGGTVSATPAVPADAVAGDVYHAALSAYNAKRYDAAVVLWKRTGELDPKMGDAWISLGLAYDRLGKYDEAAAAIQKQIDLDAFNKRAYGDLGHVLKNAHKLEDATKAYAKHVELNPLDGDALRQLGEIEFDLERYADAAAALDKATSLVKDDGWMLAVLGAAHLRVKQPDKATRAFDKALEVEPSPRVWTKIGWTLADSGVDLDRAADLASRAIKRISEEMQDVTLLAVQDHHLDLMDRLAWAWDTLGWVHFQKGKVAEAERYVHAAWLLKGNGQMAYHVGRVYEQQGRRAEALNFYVMAQATSSKPTEAMVARAKDLAGADLPKLLVSAPKAMQLYHMLKLEKTAAPGRAEFLVTVKADRHATDVRFVDGDEALRKLEGELKQATYPVEFPESAPVRLVLGIRLACTDAGCFVGVVDPGSVKTNPSRQKH